MNIKRLLTSAIAAAVFLGAAAIPARRGVQTVTQPDGTTLQISLTGDEYFHVYTTADGLTVSRGEDGFFRYLTPDGLSDITAHDAAARGTAEIQFIDTHSSQMTPARIARARRAATDRRRARAAAAQAENASQVPHIGSPRVPIILVQYSDVKFKDADPKATFESFFREGPKSAYQYFVDQSNGLYTPQFDVLGPVTLPGKRADYGGNIGGQGNDKAVGLMVAEGCLGADSSVDFSRYDNDGDGECDVVVIVYAGVSEASAYVDDAIWPCQWDLESSDYGKYLTLDNCRVNRFAVFNELNGFNTELIDGIGPFCHEFSHCLGLPDFYDTEYGPHFGMGSWSLMDSASYNDDGYTPFGYSAYEKEFMGWIEIEEATPNTLYTLPVFNQKDAATDRAVRLTNDADPDEYFIIENRQPQGWDRYMPADGGLLIYHVTYDAYAWEYNEVNNYTMQRMTPVPADNSLEMYEYAGSYYVDEYDMAGDLWPYDGARDFTDDTKPAAKVNTGGYLGKPVTDITVNDDATISFWTMKAPLPAVAAPVNIAHVQESATTALITWEAAGDADVTYTLDIREHRDITYTLVSSTDFTDEAHGWSTTGYTGVETDGIRLGSSKQLGSVTSPAFDTDADGIVTVRLNAHYYSGDESSIKISILDGTGNTVASQTVALTANAAEYVSLFSATPGTQVRVRIETLEKKKRAYIASADIYTGDATELEEAAAAPRAAGYARTITGIVDTYVRIDGLSEYAAYDYRLKAVPADTDSYTESPWTDRRLLTMDYSSGIESIPDTDATGSETVYYTLQGIRLDGAPTAPGLYIARRGTAVTKLRVR